MTTINTTVLAVSTNPAYPDKIQYTLKSESEPNGKKLNHKCTTQYAYPGDEVEVTLKPYNFNGKSGHTIEKIRVTKKGSNHGNKAAPAGVSSGGGRSNELQIKIGRAMNNAVAILTQRDTEVSIAAIKALAKDLVAIEDEITAEVLAVKASIPADAVNTISDEELPASVVF